MAEMVKVRKLLESCRTLAIYLNDEEMHEIGLILLKAAERVEKEREVDQ